MKRPRILFCGNFLLRHWGRGRTGIDMRLQAAATRLDMPSLAFSERDIARFLAPLGFIRGAGARMMENRLLRTARNWRPDVIFISHCDYVRNSTLLKIRESLPGVKTIHITCDPLATEHCRAQISLRAPVCDAIFCTTAGETLKQWATGHNAVGFFPNPSDASFATCDNSRRDGGFQYDLFFAGRPALADARRDLLNALIPLLPKDLRLGFFGMGRAPLVLGRDYEDAIAASAAGLSANRFEGWKWYASDRLEHVMSNGLLSFQHAGNSMQDFFSEKETVFYSCAEDLAEKVARYCRDTSLRKATAAAGRKRCIELFDARRVLKYMLETVAGETYSESYEWAGEVWR